MTYSLRRVSEATRSFTHGFRGLIDHPTRDDDVFVGVVGQGSRSLLWKIIWHCLSPITSLNSDVSSPARVQANSQ